MDFNAPRISFLICKVGLGRVVCTYLERVLHIAWHIVNVPEMTISAAINVVIIVFISIIYFSSS